MANLKAIEGIGEAFAAKLLAAGLATTEALRNKGATPEGREEIAEKTGIDVKKILEQLKHCHHQIHISKAILSLLLQQGQ